MTCAAYDIFRKEALDMVWIEAARDLQTARLRVTELAAASDAEYVIFDQRTRQIIANWSSPGPPIEL
jgi:hypothetical protein